MECDSPFPSMNLNSDRSNLGYMLIKDGKFSLDFPRDQSASATGTALQDVTIYGRIDEHGTINKMFLLFDKKSSMSASYRGSISTLGSTILFTANFAQQPFQCAGKLSLFPIFDDVFAKDSVDEEISISADLQKSSSKTTEAEAELKRKEEEARRLAEAEAERIRKEVEARQQAKADRLENERLAAELAASKKQEEARKLAQAKAELARKKEEARKLAEATADTAAPLIAVLPALETVDSVVEISGGIVDASVIIDVRVGGRSVPLMADGTFTIRRGVPVGDSELVVTALDEWGNEAEKRIRITRRAPADVAQIATPCLPSSPLGHIEVFS